MKLIRKFFQSRADALQLAKEEGMREARRQLVLELNYFVGKDRLLHRAPNKVPEKWMAAYELLFPGDEPETFPAEQVTQQLVDLGFLKTSAQAMVTQRSTYPEGLVVLLLAITSGFTEDLPWGLERE